MSIIKNIDLKFGAFTFKIDQLALPDYGVTAFVGPSGAGKTTFFNILLGLHNPKNWSWKIHDEDLAKMSLSERRLGVVFQNYELFPHLSAKQNVLLVYKSRHVKNGPDQPFDTFIHPYLVKLHLKSCWHTLARDLSGGEMQRVSLLRALISKPRVLLLDEPFAALDAAAREQARSLVKAVIADLDIPVYLITHDHADVQALANHIVHIRNGQVSGAEKGPV